MITTTVNTPDGGTIKIQHPEGATEESILSFAKQQFNNQQVEDQVEEQVELNTQATDGVTTEVSEEEQTFMGALRGGIERIKEEGAVKTFQQTKDMVLPGEGAQLSDPIRSVGAGAAQEVVETAAGIQQIVGEYKLADSPLSMWRMANGPMPRGMSGMGGYVPMPPQSVLDEQAEWDEQKAAAVRLGQMQMAEDLRGEVDVMQDTFGVSDEWKESGVGQFSNALGSIIPQLFTMGKSYPISYYSRATRTAEETLGKKFSEFTEEERDSVRPAALIGGVTGYLIQRITLGAIGGKSFQKFVEGKTQLSGRIIADALKAFTIGFAAEGSQEASEAFQMEALAKLFYDEGRELFSYDNLVNYLGNFVLGGFVGGITRTGTDTAINIIGKFNDKFVNEEITVDTLSPDRVQRIITAPRIKATYTTQEGTQEEVFIYSESKEEAQELLNQALEKEGKVLSDQPVEFETVVPPRADQETLVPGEDYVPVAGPEGMDIDTSEGIAKIVRQKIDLYGEEGLAQLELEANATMDPVAAAYVSIEGNNYIKYKQANDLSIIEETEADETQDEQDADEDIDEGKALEKQRQARRKQLEGFKSGKKFIALEDRKEKLEAKALALEDELADLPFKLQEENEGLSGEEIRAETIAQGRIIRGKQRQIDTQLAAVNGEISNLEPEVAEEIEADRNLSKGRTFTGRLLGKLMSPLTESVSRIDGRFKGIFRNYERRLSTQLLQDFDEVKDGFETLERLRKSRNPRDKADYRRLKQLLLLDNGDANNDSQEESQRILEQAQERERERLAQAEAEGIDPSEVPPTGQPGVEYVNGIPILNNINQKPDDSILEESTILDEFGNVINPGTRLPQENYNPEVKPVPVQGIKGAKLPKSLGKPRVNIGRVSADFESDVDRALYIVRPDGKSKRKGDYLDWLTNTLGISKKDVMELSRDLVSKTKLAAKQALKNGKSSVKINASQRIVEESKPDNYLDQLSEVAKNTFKFVRTVFPNVDIIVGGTLAETRANIVQTLKGKVGLNRATQIANSFSDMDNGQAVFIGKKPVAIIINDATANSRTVAHETWELILNQAFRNDPKRLKELQVAIDKQLRDSGFGLLADKLKRFSDQYDGDIRYSEYLAEFGATLVDSGFNQNSLNQKQSGLLTQVKKIINGFARVMVGKQMFLADANANNVMEMFVNVAGKVAKGETDIDFNQREADATEGDIDTRSQIDDRLAIPAEVNVPSKEILVSQLKPGAKNVNSVMEKLRNLIESYPNALTDREQWVGLMSRMTGTRFKRDDGSVVIPMFPEGLGGLTTVEGVLEELDIVSQEQRDLATEGLNYGKKIRNLYETGKMDQVDTALYFLWNELSVGISPYPQEAGFLRAIDGGIDQWIQLAIDGKFDLDTYLAWANQTLLPGTGAGTGAVANLNSFGRHFLSKINDPVSGGEFDGMTKIEVLHSLLTDKDTPTLELRKKWHGVANQMYFNNKIFDFVLLTTGRQDLYVIDRVRIDQFFDRDSIIEKYNLNPRKATLYDGSDFKYNNTKKAGYHGITQDISGLVLNEIAVRQTRTQVQEAYKQIGVTDSADVGRFHWETWVARSGQEVSHGSIDAILQRKDFGKIYKAGIRNGKYGDYNFNFEFTKEDNQSFRYEFVDSDGNTYTFDEIDSIQKEISKQNDPKQSNYEPEHRFILKDKNGKIIKRQTDSRSLDGAWYDQAGVDTQAYFSYLQSQATGIDKAPDVVEPSGIIVKRQLNYREPVEGVTYTDKSPDDILNVSQDDRDKFRTYDPETGEVRVKRSRDYVLKPEAMQLRELEKELLKNPNNQSLQKRILEKRIRYRQLAGLIPGHPDIKLPMSEFATIPDVVTQKEIAYSLDDNKTRTGLPNPILGVNTQIEDGVRVSLRLDIPSYRRYAEYIVSLHSGETENGNVLAYGQFARIRDVKFFSQPDAAMSIAAGGQKGTIARMHGSFVNDNLKNIKQEAEQYLAGGEWTQVGMNPERASYFYSKETGKPVISADEVIQIGGLVLARNAIEVNPDNPRVYQRFNRDAKVRIRFQKNRKGSLDPKKRAELIAKRDKLLRKHGLYDWYHNKFRALMDKKYDQQQAVGYESDYLGGFFPRSIKSMKELRKKLGLTKNQADEIIAIVNRDRVSKGKDPLTEADEAIALENYVRRNFNSLPAGVRVPGNLKPRAIDLIPDDMLDMYDDPIDSFAKYLMETTNAVETRRLLGTQEEDGVKRPGELGYLINDLRKNGQLSEDDLKQLMSTVDSVFGSHGKEIKPFQILRGLTYNAFLTNFSSTLVQFKDQALNLYRFGLTNTAKGFLKPEIALEEIGKAGKVISEEISNLNDAKLSKLFNAQTKLTGFSRFDRKMKSSTINAAWYKMQSEAKAPKTSKKYKQLVSQLKFTQGDQYIFTIAALKAGVKNDFVLEALYNKLSDQQPIGRFEMPEVYGRFPNLRIGFNLMSFTVKHFSFIRSQTLEMIIPEQVSGKRGNLPDRIRGVRNMVQIAGFMMMCGIPVDMIKLFFAGKPIYMDDLIMENLLLATGIINKFTVDNMKKVGIIKGGLQYFSPAGGSLLENIERIIKSDDLVAEGLKMLLPGDELWYWRYSDAGQDQVRETRQRKMFTEGKEELILPGQERPFVPRRDPMDFNDPQEFTPLMDPRVFR